MDTDRTDPGGNAPLFAFPEGWYFVASRESILKAGLIQKTWLGQSIVAWCGAGGSVCVAEAVCPHLGADLGPVAGGRVRDGCLVCPFHGFEYDVSGQCVATPFASPPKSAKLTVFETREVLGMVFAWWGIDGRPPRWRLPADPPIGPDWSGLEFRTVQFPGHPQETAENSVDLAHLRYVHGYDNVKQVGQTSVDGAVLESCFEFSRTRRIAGIVNVVFDVSAVTRIFGLGYSYVEVRERSIGMDTRLWVLATPVDGRLVEMVLVGQVREIRRPRRSIVGLRFLPVSLRAPIMNKVIISAQERDVMQDVVIWARKRHESRPRLCRSDGDIGVYRRYCAQFYPDQKNLGQGRRDRRSAQK
ncbi:MAG: Rieske 2Fe-2S domain-containing protein [Acidobacteriia bacterium]|nr:Rieske 2Fe-2S domain-containing protein [Terriglobia bacterium]MYK11364.1 Rieske 2Fe-2S domain-containing protein [Terriglobia bacterium]